MNGPLLSSELAPRRQRVNLAGKRVAVVGLGKSGLSASRLCARRGAKVVGTDSASLTELSPEVKESGIELRVGGHHQVDFEKIGFGRGFTGRSGAARARSGRAAGVSVIGEMELASRFVRAPIAAVGGTNGKSTTTTLLARILEADGRRVFAGANLGTPACDAVDGEFDVVVFEVSSFQLERAPTFHPKVSVLLNVTDDHLDRYPSFSEYAQAKGNAFANQTSEDVAVVPQGDAVCRAQAERGRGSVVTFGAGGDFDVQGRTVVERSSGVEYSLEGVALFGRHNLDNGAAAIAAARGLGATGESVAGGLRSFSPLGHRMARVAEIDGILFYDDSKGTNVGASCDSAARARRAPRRAHRWGARQARELRAAGRRAREEGPRGRGDRRGSGAHCFGGWRCFAGGSREQHERSRSARRIPRETGRCGAPEPRVLELRHVQWICGARRSLRRSGS